MTFYLLSFAAILAVVGALTMLTRLIVHPHLDELIQDHWSPQECEPTCEPVRVVARSAPVDRQAPARLS
jgi:DNA-binding FrmR family transcriptional regulator